MERIYMCVAVMFFLACLQAFPQNREFAVTCFPVSYLRENPDFPEELGNQLLMGTPVEVTGESGYWKQVLSPEPYRAWCVEMGLVPMSGQEMEEYIASPKYIVTAEYSHVYTAPSSTSGRVTSLVMGDLLLCRSVERRQDVRRVARPRRGFLAVELPDGTQGYVPGHDVEVFGLWAEKAEATRENILSTADLFKGVPYLWGGTTIMGVDCSGFTRMVWFMNGVLLPRNASQQAKCGMPVPFSLPETSGGELDRAAMQDAVSVLEPGDLVFFGEAPRVSHVGIYIGDGRFIHASQKVRVSSLLPGDADYYENTVRMHLARRVIGQEDAGTGVVRILDSPYYFHGND